MSSHIENILKEVGLRVQELEKERMGITSRAEILWAENDKLKKKIKELEDAEIDRASCSIQTRSERDNLVVELNLLRADHMATKSENIELRSKLENVTLAYNTSESLRANFKYAPASEVIECNENIKIHVQSLSKKLAQALQEVSNMKKLATPSANEQANVAWNNIKLNISKLLELQTVDCASSVVDMGETDLEKIVLKTPSVLDLVNHE